MTLKIFVLKNVTFKKKSPANLREPRVKTDFRPSFQLIWTLKTLRFHQASKCHQNLGSKPLVKMMNLWNPSQKSQILPLQANLCRDSSSTCSQKELPNWKRRGKGSLKSRKELCRPNQLKECEALRGKTQSENAWLAQNKGKEIGKAGANRIRQKKLVNRASPVKAIEEPKLWALPRSFLHQHPLQRSHWKKKT